MTSIRVYFGEQWTKLYTCEDTKERFEDLYRRFWILKSHVNFKKNLLEPRRKKTLCNAGASTELIEGRHNLLRVNNVHNHIANVTKKGKDIERHNMKLNALTNDAEPTSKVVQKALEGT